MKKIYKKPFTEVVKINAEQMICLSIQQKGDLESGFIIGGKDDEDYSDNNLW